jgi:hypothetical protein
VTCGVFDPSGVQRAYIGSPDDDGKDEHER